MMMRLLPQWLRPSVTVLLVLVLVTLLVPAQVGVVRAQDSGTFDVQVVDFAFQPANLAIPVGSTVTWTNTGQRPHTITAEDGSFDSGRLDPGEQFSHTFTEPGTYSYHCGFHPEMIGTITVAAGAAPIGAATPTPSQEPSSTSATTVRPAQDLT